MDLGCLLFQIAADDNLNIQLKTEKGFVPQKPTK
jgi:hypothetical protein